MNPLALDPDAMRAMGHRTVDLMVDMLTDHDGPCVHRASASDMAARLPFGVPEEPTDFEALLARLHRDVLPYMARTDHPGYMAFIPSASTFPSALGEFIATALNIYMGSWMEAAGPSRVELVVMDWFKRWIGYPAEAAGSLVTGGSAANITALACAREALLGPMDHRAVIYVSDQGHSSLARAARLLGFRPDQVRVLPTDADWRLQPETVAAAIAADAAAGLRPLLVAGAAGATNTGAIDPLAGLAAVCREHGIWLHVDAAYGAFAAISERGRCKLAGLELADSVTLDPHKWLYQPYECGAVLVREGHLLEQAFAITPPYLRDAVGHEGEVNFGDLGLQLSRSCRALKVWLSISTFGVAAYREAIDRALDLAELARRRIASDPALESMADGDLGITCFRRRTTGGEQEAARVNGALVAAYEASGRGLVSSTRLRGRYAVRLCPMSHATTAAHVEELLDFFATTAVTGRLSANGGPPTRVVGVVDGWLAGGGIDAGDLRAVTLFASLDDKALERVAGWAAERRVEAGEAAIRRWDRARDFYVVLEGAATVERDGKLLAVLGPGDFFGELAALDWGAGYGYARLATVTATAPLRLAAFAPAHFDALISTVPAAAERIEDALRMRL
jgi:glutamate/tyrosine decarboxylase-like PLP-dependent enzyme